MISCSTLLTLIICRRRLCIPAGLAERWWAEAALIRLTYLLLRQEVADIAVAALATITTLLAGRARALCAIARLAHEVISQLKT